MRNRQGIWPIFCLMGLALSSCSLLGSRQESTKKDLDVGGISQMKIVSDDSDDSESSSKTTPEGDQPSGDPASGNQSSDNSTTTYTSATYEAKFVDPVIQPKDYIEQNQINFDRIEDEKAFSKGMDRASLFFGLGAELYSKMKILELNDETKAVIPAYNEEKVAQMESDMHCSSTPQSFVVKGDATIQLDDTEVGLLMSQEDKEDYLDANLDLSKLDKVRYKDLDPDIKEIFVESFDPRLDRLTIAVAHHVVYCPSNNQQKPIAYLSNYKDYYPIENINVDKNITLNFEKVINKEELSKTTITSQNEKVPTLDKLAFNSGKKRIDVFNDSEYKKLIRLTFLPRSSSTTTTTSAAAPAETKEEPTTDAATTLTEPATPAVDLTKPYKYKPKSFANKTTTTNSSQNSNVVDSHPSVIAENPNRSKSTVKKEEVNKPKYESAKITDEEYKNLLSVDAFYQKYQVSVPKTPDWFNPSIQGHQMYSYIYNDKEKKYVYTPTLESSSFLNNDFYAADKKPLLSQAQIDQKCGNYSHKKILKFNVDFRATKNANKKDFITLSNGVKKSYRYAMLDQFMADTADLLSEEEIAADEGDEAPNSDAGEQSDEGGFLSPKETILLSVIDAILQPSEKMRKQKWKMQICYGKKDPTVAKDYIAFWSSNETEQVFTYVKKNNIKSVATDKSWVENSFQEEMDPGASVPRGFNPARKNQHSNLAIVCNPISHKCYGVFQFAFKREISPDTLMVYPNLSVMKVPNKIYRAFVKAKEGGSINRNEIWIAGGFPIDLSKDSKNVEAETSLITTSELYRDGIVSSSLSPSMSATFPGAIDLIEYEIFPTDG